MNFLVLAAALDAPPVQEIVSEEEVTYKDGGTVIAVYKFAGTVQAQTGTDRKPLAKPYYYPLVAPNGVAVTRPWPMERGQKGETVDHFHQKSAWFCHGDVIPEGVELKTKERGVAGVDFWAEAAGRHGRIVHKAM